jgi:cell division protease FtsH
MVVRYGMSEKVGPRALEIQVNRKRSLDEVNRDHSESLSKMVDEEIERIVREALATARRVVSEYKQVLEAITKRLMEVENIERDEFEGILRTYKIPVKVDEK